MMTAQDHYERLFGEFGLNPQDAARWVFASGWNAALDELIKRINSMPFGNDTRASFAVYIGSMMHVDSDGLKEKMQ
jgi:hypothetical protein